MGKNGPEFYDDEQVFATYASRRARTDGPNEILEKPIFDELMGDLAGLRILDLGCGNGWLTNYLISQGFDAYGTDASASGIAVARQKNPYFNCLAFCLGRSYCCDRYKKKREEEIL